MFLFANFSSYFKLHQAQSFFLHKPSRLTITIVTFSFTAVIFLVAAFLAITLPPPLVARYPKRNKNPVNKEIQ
jgi:hypothetical protein